MNTVILFLLVRYIYRNAAQDSQAGVTAAAARITAKSGSPNPTCITKET